MPLPVREAIACVVTAVATTMMCDTNFHGPLVGNSAVGPYSTAVAFAVGIRACAYVTLSCAWSYMVVILAGKKAFGSWPVR